MTFTRLSIAALALACSFACAGSQAEPLQSLPIGTDLIRLDGDAGASLLVASTARQAYWPLSIHFVTQATQSYCGVASMVMVLNALGVRAPAVPGIETYAMFTQDNVLNGATEQILSQAVLLKKGMTLDQLGLLVGSYGVGVEVRHASDSSVAQFREAASRHLGIRNHHVVVNYLRRGLGQERGGHISPLAAYDADTDRFLLLDVARYKYPPVWAKTADLYAAMNTVDADNQGQTRGFVLIAAESK
jgi:hypothetical protein